MTADRLREAAKVLRERAGAATPGPWTSDASWIENDGDIVAIGFRGNKVSDDPDADFIATMHPGVGLALADWLDYTADLLAIAEAEDMVRERPFRHANALADLILGGAS